MMRNFHSKKYLIQLAGIVVLTASLFSVTACAQNDQDARPDRRGRSHSREPRSVDARVALLTEKLQLTPEQAVVVKKIYETSQSEIQAMRDKMERGDRENMRVQFTKIRTDEDNSIQKLLTIEQMEAWKTYLKERQERQSEQPLMPSDDGPRRGGPPGGMNPGGRY